MNAVAPYFRHMSLLSFPPGNAVITGYLVCVHLCRSPLDLRINSNDFQTPGYGNLHPPGDIGSAHLRPVIFHAQTYR